MDGNILQRRQDEMIQQVRVVHNQLGQMAHLQSLDRDHVARRGRVAHIQMTVLDPWRAVQDREVVLKPILFRKVARQLGPREPESVRDGSHALDEYIIQLWRQLVRATHKPIRLSDDNQLEVPQHRKSPPNGSEPREVLTFT